MKATRRWVIAGTAALSALPASARRPNAIAVTTPMAAPHWAELQRRLLAANAEACDAYYRRYVGPNDELQCFERWGANDGPDDAAEFTNDWITLHALGAPDNLLRLSQRFWEAHLRQYTRVRTVETPIARKGMYHREFAVQMDWQHNAEGLTTFNVMGLSAPRDRHLLLRTRRFADLYTGRDRSVANYDPARRMMRSMMNGSRGPMLRDATALDWAGDPFDTSPFNIEHGEENYDQFLAHYREYTDVIGDNPLNLQSTTLGLNAYALGLGDRFRTWALDYLGAWAERAKANGGILPSKIGLDGQIAPDWWGGTYGWNFAPVVPQTGEREARNRVPRSITAFMGAAVLSGDLGFIKLWREQNALINAQSRQVDGRMSAPMMYGPQGWWGYKPGPYRTNAFEIWYMTQDEADREGAGDHPWIAFLEGRNPAYAELALAEDLEFVAKRVAKVRADTSTPATRLADHTLDYNPAAAKALIQTMTGGLHSARPPWSPTSPPQGGVPLHCRVRYFDPVRRRAGVPGDVAALVSGMGDRFTEITLVNTGAAPRSLIVQGGSYGEHRIDRIDLDSASHPVGDRHATIHLAPNSGAKIRLEMPRCATRPTLSFPWDR